MHVGQLKKNVFNFEKSDKFSLFTVIVLLVWNPSSELNKHFVCRLNAPYLCLPVQTYRVDRGAGSTDRNQLTDRKMIFICNEM